MASKFPDDVTPDSPPQQSNGEADSVRTASTTVASLWTSHQTRRRLLQKHFLDEDSCDSDGSSNDGTGATFHPPSTSFCRLNADTNLNPPPSNWLMSGSHGHVPPGIDQLSGFDPSTHSSGFSSFRMASHFLECLGLAKFGVDVVSDAENIKKLLRMPYSKNAVSMVVHRIGKTLLIDELDLHRILLTSIDEEWKWLRKFFVETILDIIDSGDKPLVRRNKNRDAIVERNLISKFLYRSLNPPGETTLADSIKKDTYEREEGESQSKLSQRNITFNLPHLPEPCPEDFEPKFVPSNHEFARTLLWNFEDIRMLIGSDMPIFGDSDHPSVSLRLHNMQRPINILTGLDYWLDNLMCQVPEVLMCYHLDGIVQKYELIKTEELPKLSTDCKFSPGIIRDVAKNILTFLKSNAAKEGHTYWLFKAKDDDVVKLYDLTSLCEEPDGQKKSSTASSKPKPPDPEREKSPSKTTSSAGGDDMQNPFRTAVSMLLYKVARNILNSSARKEDEGSARQLLVKCLELLDKDKFPHIATSAHYMLSDIYIPDDIDPSSVQTEDDSQKEETCEMADQPKIRKFDKKRKLSCTATTASPSTAMVAIQSLMCGDFKDPSKKADEAQQYFATNDSQMNVGPNRFAKFAASNGVAIGGGGFFQASTQDDDDFVEGGPGRNAGFVPHQINFPGEDPMTTLAAPAGTGAAAGLENGGNKPARKIKKKLVPKIYFGTRTHKQITQIVRELKKTAYKDTRMTILASREHTCINKTVMQMKNKTEGCRELTDKSKGGSCPFQANVKSKMSNHHSVNSYRGTSDAWDLEDIVKLGKKIRACPYYGTRELKNRSEIVFCPYNYLVEPLIRKSMEINLKGQIVILDEAHNIEDSARSAASWQVAQEEVQAAIQDIERVAGAGINEPESHRQMALACSQLSQWIDAFRDKLVDYTDFNSSSKVWTGTDVVALFQVHGFGPERYSEMSKHHDKVLAEWQAQVGTEEEEEENGEKKDHPKLKTPTVDIIENFILVLGHLYLKDQRYRDDFRVALVKSQSRKQNTRQFGGGRSGGWIAKGGETAATVLGVTYMVNFWCLNPAVTFDELKESVHSIVLTSGTLSPMASFSSELDVRFPIQLEANHVIDKKQVWIGTLSHGPTGHCLNATFKNAESFGFQDELGRLALNVCQTIAHGVLLFLPSYRMLQNVTERWQRTGTWAEICQKKVIIFEPKNSAEFEASMRHFYEVIESTAKGCVGDGTVDGSLFIAVCRGKVSEGLDFADDNARAVICVGIPFPNVKDIQVDLKMRYNDARRTKIGQKDILSGKEWYEIQAFRALNQALGRCIRHRRDWGAIIMVDDRFQKIGRYLNSLSKWVRSGVVHFNNAPQMIDQLTYFNQNMVKMDEEYHAKQKVEEIEKANKQNIPTLEENQSSVSAANQKSQKPTTQGVQLTQAQKLAKHRELSAQALAKRKQQYQELFPIFLPVIPSCESPSSTGAVQTNSSKRKSCDVTPPFMSLNEDSVEKEKLKVPEVITIPESPPDYASRSLSPILTRIPESPIKCGDDFEQTNCCKATENFSESKRPKLSPTNKENSADCTNGIVDFGIDQSSVLSRSSLSRSSSGKKKRIRDPPPKKHPVQFMGDSDDDFV